MNQVFMAPREGHSCVFGHVEVVEESNQGGDDPAPIGTIDRVKSRIGIRERV